MSTTEDRLRGLMLRGQDGDEAAYLQFRRESSPFLRGFLRKRLIRLPDDVEDLVQEALIAVHIQRHTYDAGQALTAWLHAIVRYRLVDLFRRRARIDAYNEPLDDAIDLLSGSDDAAIETRRDNGKLHATLPDRQRLPIVHVKLECLTVVETAQRTGMSESAVKIGIHRGMKALAAAIRTSGTGI